MAHKEQMEFVDSVYERFPEFFDGQRVLEFGSLDINGSFRPLFLNCEYVGVDCHPGPGVDMVRLAHTFNHRGPIPFDVGCSGEMFEHDPFWGLSFRVLFKNVRHGGLIFFTCATTGRAPHGTGNDQVTLPHEIWSPEPGYYKNLTEADFKDYWPFDDTFTEYEFSTNNKSHDLYFWGRKK